MYLNLRAELARTKGTQKDIAKLMGISPAAINFKVNGDRLFNTEQCLLIRDTFFPEMDIAYLFKFTPRNKKGV